MAVIEHATLEDLERSVNGLKPEVERYVADAVRVLRGEIAGTVGAAEARLTHRIEGIETKVDRIETKVERIESKVERIESKIDRLVEVPPD